MKLCFFSDIHGNGPAFRTAYPMILEEKADVYLFLGDLCGYYFDQREILPLLRSIPNMIALRGNHDQMFLHIREGNDDLRADYLKAYGPSMENLLTADSVELSQWLARLPETAVLSESGIKMYHGSPSSPLEGYIYPDSPLEEFLSDQGSVFLLGHTHYRMDQTIKNKRIVNPGSLGQPRGEAWPSYAVMDCTSKEVVFKEVRYDKRALLRQIEGLEGHHPYLKKHLV